MSDQEQPSAIGDDSMPEPDLPVVRGRSAITSIGRPTAADVALVIEVVRFEPGARFRDEV